MVTAMALVTTAVQVRSLAPELHTPAAEPNKTKQKATWAETAFK